MPFSDIETASLSKSDILDLVLRTAPVAIVTASADGSIRSFSPAAETMFGRAESDAVGRNLSILMSGTHAARHDDYMRRYLETGEARIIGVGREVPAVRASGEAFTVDLAVGELKTADDHIFTGFLRDASERAAAVARARKLQFELDKVARIQIIGEMATALAHELNQPLSAVSNFARAAALALDGERDVEKARGYVERVADQANRAGEILRRMRRLVDRGVADLRPDDVNEIVREAVRASETDVGPAHAVVRLDLAPDLPKVLADRIQIQQVVINLIRNAQDAMEDRSTTVATGRAASVGLIEMRAQPADFDMVLVTVSDTGAGVEPELLEKMFEPLYTTKPDGAGVGLAVCRSIIHAHGGRIWAENNDHGGVDVHFTLRTAAA